jgi:hypothetical protein
MEHFDGFENFLDIWDTLPRSPDNILPTRSDITPSTFGNLMPHIGLAEFLEPKNLTFSYYGSKLETFSSMLLTDKNYYDLLAEEFVPAMAIYHKQLFGTPCGAYIEDMISTADGNQYIFRNLQYPLLDKNGQARHMVVYANGRKPADDKSLRRQMQLQASSIKTLKYIDLGAGKPSNYIEDFVYHPE